MKLTEIKVALPIYVSYFKEWNDFSTKCFHRIQ